LIFRRRPMNKKTPIKSIRAFCILCQGDNQKAPALCTSLDCCLYPFRLGKNPARQGIGGKGSRKSSGVEIMPTQVGKKRQEIMITGSKRIIIEDI